MPSTSAVAPSKPPKRPKLGRCIGISGRRGVGKSTLAEIYKERYPKTVIVSFADDLKELASSWFGLPNEYFTKPELKERSCDSLNDKTPRDLLIAIGDTFRSFRRNIFAQRTMKKVDGFLIRGYDVVVPDVRFKNEADFIRNYTCNFGYLVRLSRPDNLNPYKSGGATDAHESETGLDEYRHFNIQIPPHKNIDIQDLEDVADLIRKSLKRKEDEFHARNPYC